MDANLLFRCMQDAFPEVKEVVVFDEEVQFALDDKRHSVIFDKRSSNAVGQILSAASKIVQAYRLSDPWAGYKTYWHAFAGKDAQ